MLLNLYAYAHVYASDSDSTPISQNTEVGYTIKSVCNDWFSRVSNTTCTEACFNDCRASYNYYDEE
jgi:hypothetical protein